MRHTSLDNPHIQAELADWYKLVDAGEFSSQEKDTQYNRIYNRIWMRENRKKFGAKYRTQDHARRLRDPAQRLVYATRQSAKLKQLEHNITKEDLFLPTHCPYLGRLLDYSVGNGKSLDNPSVDRIDPQQGYIKGNVEVISLRANMMKCDASIDQLRIFARRVHERFGD